LELTGSDFIENLLVGVFEGLLEAVSEGAEALGAGSLLLAASLGSLCLEGSGAGLLASFNSLGFCLTHGLGGGVKSLHGSLVSEGVLLASARFVGVDALHAEFALDLIGVDDSGEVSARHHVSAELEAGFGSGLLSVLGEDDESSEVTTRGELEEVKSVDVAGINTGEVAGGVLNETVLLTVDDQGTSAEAETGVSELTLASAELLGGADAGEVAGNTEVVEGLEELAGLLLVERVNNEGQLGHVLDSVTTGHHEGTAGSGGESGGNSVSLLVGVDLSLPLSPDLERGKHATLTAHVTESTLAGTVSTGA
jgi:hypothetical protein